MYTLYKKDEKSQFKVGVYKNRDDAMKELKKEFKFYKNFFNMRKVVTPNFVKLYTVSDPDRFIVFQIKKEEIEDARKN